MEWVTNINFPIKRTNKEALDSALSLIKDWAKENNVSVELIHNAVNEFGSKLSRVLLVRVNHKLYMYKMVVSIGKELLGKETYVGIFGGIYERNKLSDYNVYQVELHKLHCIGIGSESNKREVIN